MGNLSLGNFVVHPQKTPKFGVGDGDKGFCFFRDTLGMGTTNILGIFGDKIPKKPQTSGWGRGQENWGICKL